MHPWIIVLGVVAVVLCFVLMPVATSVFAAWRRPVRLTCPLTQSEAHVAVGAVRAALASLVGRGAHVAGCSMPHFARGCREECLAHADATWRAVTADTPPPPVFAAPPHTILVPLDGSAESEKILPVVADLARRPHVRVRLVRVVAPAKALHSEDGLHLLASADQETARVEREARAYLQDVAQRFPGVSVAATVRVADPITGVLDEVAAAGGVDLIAMAGHRRSLLATLFRRGFAARLRRATRVPTLVVPHGAPRAA